MIQQLDQPYKKRIMSDLNLNFFIKNDNMTLLKCILVIFIMVDT